MGDATWTASADEHTAAIDSTRMQAVAFGLDINDKGVQAFIKHIAAVIAAAVAGQRFYCNIIRGNTERGEYVDE